MLGLAASVQQSPIKAFTISFDHDKYDEAPIATQMAQQVHADHEILNLKAEDLYGDNFLTTLWHAERTFYNTLGVAKWSMSRRVRECGYKVVITGEGADELFGGYPAFKQDMFRHGLSADSAGKGQDYYRELQETNSQFVGAILAQETVSHPAWEARCGFTPAWIQPWILTLAKGRGLLRKDILEDLKDYDPLEAIAESFPRERVQGRHPLDVAQYTWIKTMLECQILNWGGDRVDMANGMESRPAFLDHRVAEMARHIPPHYRIHKTTEKWILREAMRHILPDVLYRRQKMAFMAPPAHTQSHKRHALQNLIDQYMSPEHVSTVGLFDPDRIAEFLQEYRTDTEPSSLVQKDALLNHVLGLHILHRTFIQAV
jgi:asparagine synthase (glutamine-hydrolysing)